jgi:hypothetical protein
MTNRCDSDSPLRILHSFADLQATVGPVWLQLVTIFLALYGSFALNYGWKYRNIQNIDLPSFHAASVSVFEHGESPYDSGRLAALAEGDTRVFPYLYPPPSLLIIAPLAALTYADARQAVLLVNHLLLLVMLLAIPLVMFRISPQRVFARSALCLVYSLSFYPIIVTLNHGQINLLMLAFLLLAWLFAKRERAALAGLLLALAVLLKWYPIILIPLLLLIRRWREGAYAAAWLALATAVSALVLPRGIWNDWLTNVLQSGGYGCTPAGLFSPAAIWNQSLNGFFARAFTESAWSHPKVVNPGLARFLTYAAAGLCLAIAGLAAWRSRDRADSLDRTILVALPTMFLVAPFSWEHHLVYVLPSILMLLGCRATFGATPRAIFLILCIVSAVVVGMEGALSLKFLGMVVLWCLCVVAAVRGDIELPTGRRDGNEGWGAAA